MVVPLKALIENMEDSALQELLSSFSCVRDADIENFLHNRAIEFENLSKARTYLVMDADELLTGKKQLIIYGYVALALKILTVPSGILNRMRKELDGFNAKVHGRQISDFPCYLIGQLSKNSVVTNNPVTGKELLNISFDIIASAVEAVGGRYVMVECRDEEKLLRFYHENVFHEIDRIPDGNVPMVQMIRKL